ncbi:other/NEK protein kinase [Coprinopsis cinerea okayama7|uniref:non-specific serine/threonine protein kinase n=1 Tax=Coprinopsis cinerea (strain Okayama-7 / 130 / ATCC MYA-4618 / FGSC 9003) TaxID=240176 RepID=A8NW92_COPC7|nr:other/NEK protein kinase [Coprinopsis cinerea okayama7\|eukprot:XP_001836862.2 other/NEK protein kinase [Coprinopsis cinerea okayama7\
MSAFLEQYEPLDVIGNGSFGIIRKVRRKSDGLIFARKELNFERMSERDRKQIVAEVNILKDLHHEHIVRYHDRHVDRDAGILYIIMEYCGGGDLSTVIKQAAKHNRPISEDLIWNYFMQILLALHHCHHPNGHGRSGSGSGSALTEGEGGGSSRRPQILHRDLKPDNVFLDENNNVKLGDFGLSKALNQASFANTYVGTPYYMSPELMQEKAYDSKSDIWSLGCLIYELCALKPPFHEAKTHNELSILIRNGRIPPLPRGYSQALFGVIKAMLNLNPAMRPSAAQLLQHERLELVFKVAETEKMLSTVKAHKNAMVAREREVLAREQIIAEKEQHLQHLFSQKDSEIAHLQRVVSQLQAQIHTIQSEPRITQHDLEVATKHAVARREQELRILVQKREEEVAAAMAKREEEIMEAVRRREAEVCEAWAKREAEVRQEVEVSIKAVEERIQWISEKEAELIEEEERLEALREELEVREKRVEELANKKGRTKSPLEEIRNTMEPTPQRRNYDPPPSTIKRNRVDSTPRATTKQMFPAALETPITRPSYTDYLPSAMKGVVLTSTGETLATPSPNELATLFNASPKVGLNFGKIFDFGEGDDDVTSPTNTTTRLSLGGAGSGLNGVGASGVNGGVQFPNGAGSESDEDDAPPSPTTRKERELRERAESRSSLGGGEDATVTIAMNLGSATNGASVSTPTQASEDVYLGWVAPPYAYVGFESEVVGDYAFGVG